MKKYTIAFIVFFLFQFFANIANAKYLSTTVCNKGEQDITYAVYSINIHDMEPRDNNGIVKGWYTLKKGECKQLQYIHCFSEPCFKSLNLQYLSFIGNDRNGDIVYLTPQNMKSKTYKTIWGTMVFEEAKRPYYYCVRLDKGFNYKSIYAPTKCPNGAKFVPFTFVSNPKGLDKVDGDVRLEVYPPAPSKIKPHVEVDNKEIVKIQEQTQKDYDKSTGLMMDAIRNTIRLLEADTQEKILYEKPNHNYPDLDGVWLDEKGRKWTAQHDYGPSRVIFKPPTNPDYKFGTLIVYNNSNKISVVKVYTGLFPAATATVMQNGDKIKWGNGVTWTKQQSNKKPTYKTKQQSNKKPTQKNKIVRNYPDLSGKWFDEKGRNWTAIRSGMPGSIMFYTKSKPYAKGVVNVYENSNKIEVPRRHKESFPTVTATLIEDGKKIKWGSGEVWSKQQ